MASTPTTPKKRGRPKAAEKKLVNDIIKNAKTEGVMPHEILLNVARGNPVKVRTLVITKVKSGPNRGEEKSREWVEQDYYPSFQEQIDCAKSAAPYFAPRLATQTVKTDETTADALTEVMKQLAGKLPG